MSWSAYLFHTTSGQIGPRIAVETLSWSMSLNDIESCKLVLKKSDMPKVDHRTWLAPWWGGIALFYDRAPIFAGPIIGRPMEYHNEIHIEAKGIRSILARRFVIHEQSNWDKLAKSVVRFEGFSLGTIAQKVVQLAQLKPGGQLPITYPVPVETAAKDDDADHQRTYRGFNLTNIDADAVLTKLSNVSRGPDIMFKARRLPDERLTFDMWHGTEDNPRIAQKQLTVWDTTAERGSVTGLAVTMTGAHQTHRVFALGAGMDEGQLIRVAENLEPTAKGFPLLETTRNTGDSENEKVVMRHAEESLRANTDMLQEITLNVRADGNYRMGSFWPGDEVLLVTKGWLSLKDGEHKARLLAMQGNLTNDVRLSLQIED